MYVWTKFLDLLSPQIYRWHQTGVFQSSTMLDLGNNRYWLGCGSN